MELRLGQPVHSTDGLFGEVADIVIDPLERKVTHLVVEPHKQHRQARLVPMWLISIEPDVVKVALTTDFLRQLQRVACNDFLRGGEQPDVGDEWEIGTQDVIALPYWEADADFRSFMKRDAAEVSYDRIPKGDCEIRRCSEVTTSDYQVVGHVEGFLAEDDYLVAVIVQTGLPGFRHAVVVPMSLVAKVFNDEVLLALDKDSFSALPRSDQHRDPGDSRLGELEQRVSEVTHRVSARATRLADRAKHRFDRPDRDEGGSASRPKRFG